MPRINLKDDWYWRVVKTKQNQQMRLLRAKAKKLFALHGLGIVHKYRNNFSKKDFLTMMLIMCKRKPEKFILITKKYLQEIGNNWHVKNYL